MLAGLLPRRIINHPARILLIFIIVLLFFTFPSLRSTSSQFHSHKAQDELSNTPPDGLITLYDTLRYDILRNKGFSPGKAAQKIRAPLHFADGKDTFDTRTEVYVERLRAFVEGYLEHAPVEIKRSLHLILEDLLKKIPPGRRFPDVPRRVTSTSPTGRIGIHDHFALWEKLLPLPLSDKLLTYLAPLGEEIIKLVREGEGWEVEVPDDDGMDGFVSEWTGEVCRRGSEGKGRWSKMWGELPFGVLRSDVFRYLNLLMRGGIYADSDTAPIAHPYLWGIHSLPVLHPDLESLIPYLTKASTSLSPPATDRLNPRTEYPTYNNSQLRYPPTRRAPTPITQVPVSSILNSDISLIVSIEWDSHIAFDPTKIMQWSWYRLTRSWSGSSYARSLQILQYITIAKPFHPVMLDTIATIAELVDQGDLQAIGALDLTGPGPFTDAVLRYLLVQYGVTSEDLRNLRHSARVGDVLILHEESFMVRDNTFARFVAHVDSILGSAGGKARDVWLWGIGDWSWRSGGRVVARHGLQGLWKGQGW